jgi:hypothetical protein
MDGTAETGAVGFTLRRELATPAHPNAIKVIGAGMATLNISGKLFPPEWNFPISQRPPLYAAIAGRRRTNAGPVLNVLSRVRQWQARNPEGAGRRWR